ncbi:MAG: hypothetical protein KBS91_00055 [Firmicutes bacterium]|nr:hypothetical protein [Candidatus Caballimonas caccae]
MFFKRVTIFSGHYGSGKTNIAVNYAKAIKKDDKQVSIYDLDIVNPYFRTVDAKEDLEKNGVELVVSPYAETNVDIPAMNAMSYKINDDKSRYAVIDLGGDDRGALALGRFSGKILEENNYEFVYVVNAFRPETRDLEGLTEIKNEIEQVAKMKFTSIVNNTNLSNETTIEDIENSFALVKKFSEKFSLPILFTSVRRDLYNKIQNKENYLPLDLIKYGEW